MYRSDNWEKERYIYELLKQTQIFRQWKKLQFDCQTGKCAWCKKPMQYRYAETDHIKPLYYGGTSEAQNMVLCHHNCNKNKSTRTGYTRPDWIGPNHLDARVDGKYRMLYSRASNNQSSAEKRYSIVNPDRDVRNMSIDSESTEINAKKVCGIIIAIIAVLIPLGAVVSMFGQKSTTENQPTQAGQGTSNQLVVDLDAKRKSYAESILASYTNYYNNYVASSYKWGLPNDNYNCGQSGDGCYLTMYSKASLPAGYTYSINTLENGKTLSQPGVIPHASLANVALYKRARCGTNGAVVGGSDSKNAASVVQLSDGSYYCVQN